MCPKQDPQNFRRSPPALEIELWVHKILRLSSKPLFDQMEQIRIMTGAGLVGYNLFEVSMSMTITS